MRYTSLGTQIMVYLFLAVFGGLKLDEWLHATPLFKSYCRQSLYYGCLFNCIVNWLNNLLR